MAKPALDLYQKYFQGRQFERLDLFQIIADEFNIQRALYAGSFVHVTPSFVFPDVVYVDNDKQAKQFFGKPEIFMISLPKERFIHKKQKFLFILLITEMVLMNSLILSTSHFSICWFRGTTLQTISENRWFAFGKQ